MAILRSVEEWVSIHSIVENPEREEHRLSEAGRARTMSHDTVLQASVL
jgi:hypothetical protein